MQDIKVFISENEVFVTEQTLSVNETIKTHQTASFSVIDFQEINHFIEDEVVKIYKDEELIFSGVIASSEESGFTSKGVMIHSVSCKGNRYYANGIIVRAYTNQTSDYIVNDIYNTRLAEEGITIGQIDSGPVIRQESFNYITAAEALDKICDRTGYHWFINQNKELYFLKRDVENSPFKAEWDNILRGSVRVKHTNPKYRNVQYLTGCKGITSERDEIKEGDGVERSFTVGYPIAREPTIEVDTGSGYSPQTVGIKGLDEGNRRWYYTYNSDTITQDESETPLEEGHMLKITYKGLYNLVVKVQNPNQIYKKKEINEGSGKIEKVTDERYRGLDESLQAAENILSINSTNGVILQYRTDLQGLKAGMMQEANLPQHELNGHKLLITEVRKTVVEGIIENEVTAVMGPQDEDWTSYFIQKEKRDEAVQVDTVQPVFSFTKIWEENEDPNLFTEPLKLDFNTDAELGFGTEVKIKYIAWYENGVEVGRKEVVSESISDTEVFSIGFISTTDFVGTISHIAWIVGYDATIELGTGFEIDKQEFNQVKTNLEIFQIEKTDERIVIL